MNNAERYRTPTVPDQDDAAHVARLARDGFLPTVLARNLLASFNLTPHGPREYNRPPKDPNKGVRLPVSKPVPHPGMFRRKAE